MGNRRWGSHHWICCALSYKDFHHEPMGRGYTALFFLDEVTALAAGHRPCFFCRRMDAKAFLGDQKVDAFDRQLHGQRISRHTEESGIEDLPDGVMVDIGGEAYAVKGPALLHWSFMGYTAKIPRGTGRRGRILTPPAITAILAKDYKPRWHESALTGDTE